MTSKAETHGAAGVESPGCLPVDAPRTVDPESVTWAHHCDVLVVGLGAAGAAAAVSARDAGADVLICERFEGGGATTKSGGIVYLGGGTPYQKAAGYDDTPEAMFRYLTREVGDAVSPDTLRRFCDDSLGLLDWLESLGVRFATEAQPPKTSYPRNGVFLYYSGNEAVPANAALAPPAPRGHRVVAKGMSGGGLFRTLRAAVQQRRIPVMQQAAVHRLLRDRSGRIVGADIGRLPPGSAAAQRHRRLMRWADGLHNAFPGLADRLRRKAAHIEQHEALVESVRAHRGVVLTTGGFIFNRAMVAEHAPAFLPNMRLGATGCDGSGIRLGIAAGAQAARLDKVSAWRFINPPQALPQGIIVNTAGKRFCNEQVYGATLGVQICATHGGKAWLIVDRDIRRRAIRESLFGRLWAFQSIPALLLLLTAPRARSLAALARRIKVDPAALSASVHSSNQTIADSKPDPFGKSDDIRRPLHRPPYYAMDISNANPVFPFPAITLGGLRVDEGSGAVLDGDGQVLSGLYAAGRAAIGVASNGYVSGLSLADCFWSGRRAGAAAATTEAEANFTEDVRQQPTQAAGAAAAAIAKDA